MTGAHVPDESFERVLSAIADGDSVAAACKRTGACDRSTFFRKVRSDPEFSRRFDQAVEERAEARMEKYDDIMRRLEEGTLDPQGSRILLESLRWQMGRDSARYADRTRTEITGKDGRDLIPPPKEPDLMEEARWIGSLLFRSGITSLDQIKETPLLEAFST